MKTIVQDEYGSPDVLELRDTDRPEIADDEVLVRVRAAGVNPGDWAVMSGLPYIARPVYGLRKPKNAVRGTDVAGTVEAVGTGVRRFQRGDEVFGWCSGLGGAFAEYASVSEDALAPKPANLTFEQAAAVDRKEERPLLNERLKRRHTEEHARDEQRRHRKPE
jgi:NADPH:quinone reductase-like Zn-dependent oxidoreductase